MYEASEAGEYERRLVRMNDFFYRLAMIKAFKNFSIFNVRTLHFPKMEALNPDGAERVFTTSTDIVEHFNVKIDNFC